jgi:WD40 repeat protein
MPVKKSVLFLIMFSLFLLFHIVPLSAQDTPQLFLDPGGHQAIVRKVVFTSDEKYLLTCSDDKTVKVWDIATGECAKTFRGYIDEGAEGKIFTIALSADDKYLAVGGFIGDHSKGRTDTIRIYDFQTGQIIKLLKGHKDVINNLEFSPDGNYLASASADGTVIIWAVKSNFNLRHTLVYHTKNIYGISFSHDRKYLASASYDAAIAIWDLKTGILIRSLDKAHDKEIRRIEYSMDDSYLATGSFDGTVKLWRAKDLSLVKIINKVDEDNTTEIKFSPDQKYLIFGGDYPTIHNGEWRRPIYFYNLITKKIDRTFWEHNNTIMSVTFANSGNYFASTGGNDNETYIYDSKTLQVKQKIVGLGKAIFSTAYGNDGQTIYFGNLNGAAGNNTKTIQKSFSLRDFSINHSPDNRYTRSYENVDGNSFQFTDGTYNKTIKIGDHTVTLPDDYDTIFSYTFTPNKKYAIIGSCFALTKVDAQTGAILGTFYGHTSLVWAVSVSADSRYLLSGSDDQTLKLWDIETMKNIVTIFIGADDKWVIWTPKGYYNCSVGADNLIGWHINHGEDQAADFFPVAKFRSLYYRPDIIEQILITGDEEKAIRLADEAVGRKESTATLMSLLPPVVTILSPQDYEEAPATELTIRYQVHSSSGNPITAIRVLCDGRPLEAQRGISIAAKADTEREIKVTIPERDCKISLIAETASTVSEPANVRIKWQGKAVAEQFTIKSKLYLLAIGLSEYENKDFNLGLAGKDAADFSKTMIKQKGLLYSDVVVKVLTNAQATKDNILDGLEWIQNETTSKDVAMVFIAGHGINDNTGIYYFLPYNANLEKIKRTCVVFSDIQNTLKAIAGKVILFADTCHSGNIMSGRRAVDINGFVNELISAENGIVVFAASTGRQYSLEDPSWGNGAFTKALIEGLSGQADYLKTGKITVNMLDLYISERVKALTKGKQTPTTAKPNTVSDFPVVVLK